jgi:hypothetical protein
MLHEFFFENPFFSLKPSSTIAIEHSTHLFKEIGIVFIHHLSFSPLYEEKSSQLGNSISLPRGKRGLISPFLSLRCFSYQSIYSLVAICWSYFYFHGSKFLKLSNIYFLVFFSYIILFSHVFGLSNPLTNFYLVEHSYLNMKVLCSFSPK